MIRLSTAALLLLFASTTAHAQEASAPATTPATTEPIIVEAETPKEEKVICRRVAETGSIRMKRVCKTESQIAQEQAQGERTLGTARTQRNTQNLSQNRSGG